MTDETWRRHANPWSVWTRYATFPLLVLAIWSRVWIGWWSLCPILAMVYWLWINPRFFPVPTSTNNWASKAVLGERVWLNRRRIPLPLHHREGMALLTVMSLIGVAFLVWGLAVASPFVTAAAAAWVLAVKTWSNHRMTLLYDEMKDASPEYRAWLYDHRTGA